MKYEDAGVNIAEGNALVESIKSIAQKTHRPGVLTGLGGFGALFEIPSGYNNPVLVSGTDGVGTKLKLAVKINKNDTIGIDLVAMCVNDIITSGAEPLFFLDYFATGKLNAKQAQTILSGIGKGCELAGAALVGGETAEMPGVYQGKEYDLAGFCVGIVEKSKIIQGDRVKPGDTLIALASSGPHSNGYSLIRKVIEVTNTSLEQNFGSSTLAETLLTPTRIYAKSILTLLKQIDINAMAHITGGGLLENIPRVLPQNTQARLEESSWEIPEVFTWLQEKGDISETEMQRTFNLGVGMVLAINPEESKKALEILEFCGENAWIIGEVAQSESPEPSVVIV